MSDFLIGFAAGMALAFAIAAYQMPVRAKRR